ncbi:transglycosylase SLT domain-containing protein [Alcanivorax sp. CY1518]|uniref:Transglycosylase SLT domain-containing protein n=1 Tax=Alcanivorax quisquiliarum TaxID=2933565 RepID=A0ABT0E733_9GAMM|nr:transglycosylase SLT domain-containing protein [Alcanivorax quisquiliarum]
MKGPPSVAPADVALFRAALGAAREGNIEQLDLLQQQLGDDYLMQGYLDFHRLRAALPELPPAAVSDFMTRYRDLPLANAMERIALGRYGLRHDWASLRALRDRPPATPELACFYWRAVHDASPQRAYEAIPSLWLSGASRPDACDPLFAAARQAGVIDDDLIWQRLLLVFRQGNPGLMRYLNGLQSETEAASGQHLRQLYNTPALILSLAPTTPRYADLAAAALHRWAHLDTPAALAGLQQLRAAQPDLAATISQPAERRIAWYSVIRDLPENRSWVDSWLREHGDEELLEQRARRAVIEQRWRDVLAWTERLPAARQASARWQYWQARAHQQTGHPAQAEAAYRNAAAARSFWGFAASDQLRQPYTFNAAPAPANEPLPPLPALQRVAMLVAVDEPALARDEWLALLRREPDHLAALAEYALQQGWPALAVDTALHAGAHDVLRWRFPQAFREQFLAAASEAGLDPYLLMAVARRESAFHSHATSPVGARGLMQVMPGTARQIAGWLDEPAPATGELYDPLLSIRLGSTYLTDLLNRYQGNRLLALAAYNAGPQRVDEWLNATTMPFDVWIESIPYYETREYVQAVLAYRVLLEHLHTPQDARRQRLVSAAERHPGYHIALLEEP